MEVISKLWKLIKKINAEWLALSVLFALTICFISISGYANHKTNADFLEWEWIDGLFQNAGTEMFGGIVSIILFELLIHRSQQVHEKQERQEEQRYLRIQQRNDESKQRLFDFLTARNRPRNTVQNVASGSTNLKVLHDSALENEHFRETKTRHKRQRGNITKRYPRKPNFGK